MEGNLNSGAKNIGYIAGASASSSPILLNSIMHPINNKNVECVGSGPTTNVGIQNPSSSL
jgi:hypothetical protein